VSVSTDEGGLGGYGEEVIYRGFSYVPFNSNQIKNIDNLNPTEDNDIRYSLDNVTLIIPPIGLEIYESEKTTNVVSPTSLVDRIDIENVISLIQKETIDAGKEIVDIIPDFFIVNKDECSLEPPVGKTSQEVTVHAKVHVMLKRVLDSYRNLAAAAGITVKRIIVSPYAVTTFARNSGKLPKEYLLVEMGAQLTNVTLVGCHVPYSTANIFMGGNDLSLAISEKFEIPEHEATRIKELYGYNLHELVFEPTITSKEGVDGGVVEYKQSDLNHAIELFFRDQYFKEIKTAIRALLQGVSASALTLPIVFTGGLEKLRGFKKLAENEFKENNGLFFLESDVAGLRHPRNIGIIGSMLFTCTYKGSLSDQRVRVQSVTRSKRHE